MKPLTDYNKYTTDVQVKQICDFCGVEFFVPANVVLELEQIGQALCCPKAHQKGKSEENAKLPVETIKKYNHKLAILRAALEEAEKNFRWTEQVKEDWEKRCRSAKKTALNRQRQISAYKQILKGLNITLRNNEKPSWESFVGMIMDYRAELRDVKTKLAHTRNENDWLRRTNRYYNKVMAIDVEIRKENGDGPCHNVETAEHE